MCIPDACSNGVMLGTGGPARQPLKLFWQGSTDASMLEQGDSCRRLGTQMASLQQRLLIRMLIS